MQDESIDHLLQLLAVMIRRHGGEVTITERELALVEDIPIMVARDSAPGTARIYLAEEEMFGDVDILDF